MESYESVVAVALESEGFVVGGPVKFPMVVHVQKKSHSEEQTHWFEVDLVGARADRLVLATVKSYFGSRGVAAEQVIDPPASARNGYRILNDPPFHSEIVRQAADRYGYEVARVRVRFYVGHFAAASAKHEQRIRDWCATTVVGGGPVEVLGPNEVAEQITSAAQHTQYRDNPILTTIKLLTASGRLTEAPVPINPATNPLAGEQA